MGRINILAGVSLTDQWLEVQIPDNVRHSLSFQLESLGVLHWSMDGVVGMKVVGTGETLMGNFSKRSMYFKCDTGETGVLQMRTQDI